LRLSHVEGAVLLGDSGRRAEGVADVLATCVALVRAIVPPGSTGPPDLSRVEPRLPVRAPIAGVHAAVAACRASAVLVAACDLPEVEPRLLLALLALTPCGDGPDIVVPVGPDGPVPLLGVYRPPTLAAIEGSVEHGDLSLEALLREVRTLEVPAENLRAFDPELRSLGRAGRSEARAR
jgi:molybdopterin-guanine dinucleotide biosynthesis protein A